MTDYEDSADALTEYAEEIGEAQLDLIDKVRAIGGEFSVLEVRIYKDTRLTESARARLLSRLDTARGNIVHNLRLSINDD